MALVSAFFKCLYVVLGMYNFGLFMTMFSTHDCDIVQVQSAKKRSSISKQENFLFSQSVKGQISCLEIFQNALNVLTHNSKV